MTPERKIIVGKLLVEEYYWAGKLVVYINNQSYEGTFEEAINKVKNCRASPVK